MNRLKTVSLAVMAMLAILACGESGTDSEGLAGRDNAMEQFTRASQLYFRGRLSAALEEFNGVIYRFPDSPFAADSRLAARRVETDLTGVEVVESGNGQSVILSSIAVVGSPSATGSMNLAAELLQGTCRSVSVITDHQAPELTMVFHTRGSGQDASVVADSLDRWLLRPETISMRPGEDLIEAVSPGFDILVIIGEDAVFEPSTE